MNDKTRAAAIRAWEQWANDLDDASDFEGVDRKGFLRHVGEAIERSIDHETESLMRINARQRGVIEDLQRQLAQAREEREKVAAMLAERSK